MTDVTPQPVARLGNVYPGQIWNTKLGGTYKVVACMSDGYAHLLDMAPGSSVDRIKPVFMDTMLTWTLDVMSPVGRGGLRA